MDDDLHLGCNHYLFNGCPGPTCQRPCSARKAALLTIDLNTERAKANRELLAYAAAFVFVVAFGLLGAAVVNQGAENWRKVATQNQEP